MGLPLAGIIFRGQGAAMPDETRPLILDGHNDVLLKLQLAGGRGALEAFATGRPGGDIDLPRAREAGFAGGFFAVFVLSPGGGDPEVRAARARALQAGPYDLPPAAPVAQPEALAQAMEQIALLLDMQRRGWLRICTTTADIRACMAEGVLAAILHLEGAEPIDADLNALEVLYAAGLRSLGPVWARPNAFGEGVPFRFPSDGDIGGGLTEAGRALVRRCNDLGVLVDLSHLNAAGFWDAARISTAPLVATHSNAHAIAPQSRNLTDDQLRAIADTGGLVGVNFGAMFLRPDGQLDPELSLDIVLRHLDHLVNLLGEDGVALGSDFDGARMPVPLADVTGLNGLRRAMRAHGFDQGLMRKLCHENWLRVLAATWGEEFGAIRQRPERSTTTEEKIQ